MTSALKITVNGAFESPSLDEWLVLDEDSADASLEQLLLADAMSSDARPMRASRLSGRSWLTRLRWLASPIGSTACRSTSRRER